MGRVTEVAKYYEVDEQTLIPNVQIGYVSPYVLLNSEHAQDPVFCPLYGLEVVLF